MVRERLGTRNLDHFGAGAALGHHHLGNGGELGGEELLFPVAVEPEYRLEVAQAGLAVFAAVVQGK